MSRPIVKRFIKIRRATRNRTLGELWDELPPEMHGIILSENGVSLIMFSRAVCREWRDLVAHAAKSKLTSLSRPDKKAVLRRTVHLGSVKWDDPHILEWALALTPISIPTHLIKRSLESNKKRLFRWLFTRRCYHEAQVKRFYDHCALNEDVETLDYMLSDLSMSRITKDAFVSDLCFASVARDRTAIVRWALDRTEDPVAMACHALKVAFDKKSSTTAQMVAQWLLDRANAMI